VTAPTADQKYSTWYDMYRVIVEELTPPELQALVNLQSESVNNADTPRFAIEIATNAMREMLKQRRSAALVAAILTTQGGLRIIPVDADE
jgi:hypothetical protein